MEMDTSWRTALWRQFGAAIDMFDNALVACPAALWTQRLWRAPPPPEFPPQFAEFWYVSFHALRAGPSRIPGQQGSPSAIWSCNSTICATSRNMRPT